MSEQATKLQSSGKDEQVVWALTRGHLEEMVGRPLTDEEVARVAKCFEYSSIGDVINGVTESCGLWPPDEDDGDACTDAGCTGVPICPEHPAHIGDEHTYEMHHDPSDHVGGGECRCTG